MQVSQEGALVLVEFLRSSDQLRHDGLALLEKTHRGYLLLLVAPLALQELSLHLLQLLGKESALLLEVQQSARLLSVHAAI